MTTVSSDKQSDAEPECEWMLAISQPCRHSQPLQPQSSCMSGLLALETAERNATPWLSYMEGTSIPAVQHAISY